MPSIAIVKNLEAAAEVAGKLAVKRAVFDAMLPEIKARAICISGVQDLDVVQRVRDAIAALPRGADWRSVRKQVATEISPYLVDAEDAAGRKAQEREARNRAELLMRTHGFQAYAAARYRAQMDPRSGSGYLRYSTQGDTRVRPEHKALDGLILPKSDPFWRTHYPPWGYGCRCVAIEMEDAEVNRIETAENDLPPDKRTVLPPDQRQALAASDRLLRDGRAYYVGPSASGKNAYTWQPGQSQMPLDAVMKRYDDDTGRAFSRAMRAAPLAPAARQVGRENVWDLMFGELRDRDLAALVNRERRGTPVERAIARDVDLSRNVGKAVEGSRNQVHVGPLLQEARRSGSRISILHNHTSGDVRPSPKDVALLVGSHDVVAEVGIGGRSIGASGFKSSVMRLGRNTTPSGRAAALQRIRGMLDEKGGLAVSRQTWQSYFDRLVRHGVLIYVQQ